MKIALSKLCLVSFFLTSSVCFAMSPVGWRTDGTGKYPNANPPTKWSDTENVIWKTPLPGFSNATPVITGDKIFICSEPDILICVSKSTGKILWQSVNSFLELIPAEEREKAAEMGQKGRDLQKELDKISKKMRPFQKKLKKNKDDEEAARELKPLEEEADKLKKDIEPLKKYMMPATHDVNGYSSPTPVTDGKYLYVTYTTGVAASYNLDGKRNWMVSVEKPWHEWGASTSLMLAGGKLIVYVKNVVALDTKTGKEVWTFTPEYLKAEKPRWGSMIQTVIDKKEIIITPNADILLASNGKALVQRLSPLEYNTPIIQDGIIYFIQHGGQAFKLPAKVSGEFKPEPLWVTKPKNDRYYASPVIHQGLIYDITRKNEFSVINASNGEVILEEKLKIKKEAYPSITLAGAYLYVSSDNGITQVYKPGRKPELVAENTLETFRSSPVFEGKRLYIRAEKHLYCIGK